VATLDGTSLGCDRRTWRGRGLRHLSGGPRSGTRHRPRLEAAQGDVVKKKTKAVVAASSARSGCPRRSRSGALPELHSGSSDMGTITVIVGYCGSGRRGRRGARRSGESEPSPDHSRVRGFANVTVRPTYARSLDATGHDRSASESTPHSRRCFQFDGQGVDETIRVHQDVVEPSTNVRRLGLYRRRRLAERSFHRVQGLVVSVVVSDRFSGFPQTDRRLRPEAARLSESPCPWPLESRESPWLRH